jgi:pimeloyl-ACP methyl ester carboxylesterase
MPGFSRRKFVGAAAATVVAGPPGLLDVSRRLEAVAETLTKAARRTSGAKADVRPFHVSFPNAQLTDLRRRIKATRWPERETVTDYSQGVKLETMQALAEYWGTKHEWRRAEARLNSFPQFITEIDGLDIHFIHLRSKHESALPLVITHGWPGSVIEQLKVIEPLANPTAYGSTAADAFHVVVPSLPGYGFSGKPTSPGWHPPRIARAWTELMRRLGYKKFVAQGGDWGNAVSEQMALQSPPELLGISTNMAATVPADVAKALAAGGPPPAGLSNEERHAWDQLDFFNQKGLGYANEMALRRQTLYGLVDSPIGLAAWILDHDAASQALIARVFAGQREGLTRDDILDNVTVYWLTNTAISSARLYWDNLNSAKAGFFDIKNVTIPVAVSAFPEEIYQAPRSWAERAYPRLIHYNKLDKGGHFAAWEQPELFVAEVRESFKSLRQG